MIVMNYYRILTILGLILCFGTPAAAGNIQQGIHRMKWGSSISEYNELTKVHEVNQAAYYVNSNMAYRSANQPVPAVFYGFYRDQFFAVFIKLRSPDQFSQLERQFKTKYGKPNTIYYPDSQQTVHRWTDADVKIKLKMKESPQEFKLAFYYAPLAAKLNQDQLESIPADAYDKIPSPKDAPVTSAPLLDY
jgi:hypothetical protein